jgi:hypothetical protein
LQTTESSTIPDLALSERYANTENGSLKSTTRGAFLVGRADSVTLTALPNKPRFGQKEAEKHSGNDKACLVDIFTQVDIFTLSIFPASPLQAAGDESKMLGSAV